GLQDLRVRWTAAPLWTQMVAAVMSKCKTVVGIKEEWLQQVIDAALAASVAQPGSLDVRRVALTVTDLELIVRDVLETAHAGRDDATSAKMLYEDAKRAPDGAVWHWAATDADERGDWTPADLVQAMKSVASSLTDRAKQASVAQPGPAKQAEPAEPTTGDDSASSSTDERKAKLHRLKLLFMQCTDALTLWSQMTGREVITLEARRGLRAVIDTTSDLIDGKSEEG
ncbi:MAG: hypothetical protein KAX65_14240, partial [Caldilineaceae bacterium]|nr:hypothetical protein [Caldilineaceae bacterium]